MILSQPIKWTGLFTLPGGTVCEYDSVSFIALVEEDRKLQVREFKDVSDPEKRGKLFKALTTSIA